MLDRLARQWSELTIAASNWDQRRVEDIQAAKAARPYSIGPVTEGHLNLTSKGAAINYPSQPLGWQLGHDVPVLWYGKVPPVACEVAGGAAATGAGDGEGVATIGSGEARAGVGAEV